MLGVVMCGGQSSRMGRDKALLQSGNRTWTELAVDKLSALGIPVVVSINPRQETALREVIRQPLISDNPAIPAAGPLLGLMSVHKAIPIEDIFVLACDLPLMEHAVLELLYQRYLAATTAPAIRVAAQAYLFTSDSEPEPMCAIYTAAALAKVFNLLQNNGLATQSLKYMLLQLTVDAQPVPDGKAHCFTNVNSPEELQHLVP